jgi:hypothetical protein
MQDCKVTRPAPRTLRIAKSAQQATAILVFVALLMPFWYYLLGKLSIRQSLPWVFWLMMVFPLGPAVMALVTLVQVWRGDHWLIDGVTRTILHNDQPQARFDDVSQVQIRVICQRQQDHSSERYRVSLLGTNERKFTVLTTGDRELAESTASDIADLTGRRVVTV